MRTFQRSVNCHQQVNLRFFVYMSRLLFANHREVFSFLTGNVLLRPINVVTGEVWKLLLKGPMNLDDIEDPNKEIERTVGAKMERELCQRE